MSWNFRETGAKSRFQPIPERNRPRQSSKDQDGLSHTQHQELLEKGAMSNLEFCSDQASRQGHWEEGGTPSKGGSQLWKWGVGLLDRGPRPGERQSGLGTGGPWPASHQEWDRQQTALRSTSSGRNRVTRNEQHLTHGTEYLCYAGGMCSEGKSIRNSGGKQQAEWCQDLEEWIKGENKVCSSWPWGHFSSRSSRRPRMTFPSLGRFCPSLILRGMTATNLWSHTWPF